MITQEDIDAIQDTLESIPTNLEEDRRNSRAVDALKHARVVGVLDAWAEARGVLTPAPRKVPQRNGGGYIVFTTKQCRGYRGPTRDAARDAAAKAIEAGEVG